MKKILLSILIAGSAYAEDVPPHAEMKKPTKYIDHAGLTREEVAMARSDQDYYPVHDIISKQTVFVSIPKAMEYFLKSINYYNKPLAATTKKAILKAQKEDKRQYVNIIGGSDIPEHRFGARNNVYKVAEAANGQYTIFYVDSNGMISKDHYECGEYGQLGRDGISFEHAVKTFGAVDIRKAVERAKKSNKDYNWEVIVKFPDMRPTVHIFNTYAKYEEWFNRTKLPSNIATFKKVRVNVRLEDIVKFTNK